MVATSGLPWWVVLVEWRHGGGIRAALVGCLGGRGARCRVALGNAWVSSGLYHVFSATLLMLHFAVLVLPPCQGLPCWRPWPTALIVARVTLSRWLLPVSIVFAVNGPLRNLKAAENLRPLVFLVSLDRSRS